MQHFGAMKAILIALALVACTPAAESYPDSGSDWNHRLVDATPPADAQPRYTVECWIWCGAKQVCEPLVNMTLCHTTCTAAPEGLEFEACVPSCGDAGIDIP